MDQELLEKAIDSDRLIPRKEQGEKHNASPFGDSNIEEFDLLAPLFTQHLIPKRNAKKSKEFRVVWEANTILADAYKAFARRFELFVRAIEPRFPHTASYGYVRGRNILDNAAIHCGALSIIHADIENFFPSISSERVSELLSSFGIQDKVVEVLTQFLTIEGSLPLGLHPSPLLANLVCLNLDDKFNNLALAHNCTYSRYADDIAISGNSKLPSKADVESLLITEGFKLSERKFRITKNGQAHFVTGLSVSDSVPHVPRAMKRRLRQELYFSNKFGIENHLGRISEKTDGYIQRGVNRIDGTVRYVTHIERERLGRIREYWGGLLYENGLEVSYETLRDSYSMHFWFFIDETEFECMSKKYLALALIKTSYPEDVTVTTEQILREHLIDPFTGGRKKNLEKKRLHFTDSSEDLKAAYIKKLATLPYNGYVAFAELRSSEQYQECYFSLIKSILPHRFMGCDYDTVTVVIEENSRINRAGLEATINEVYNTLKDTNNRRPMKIGIEIKKKSEVPCFSVPDYLLGIFSKFALLNLESDPQKKERKALFFERIRDKYRIILDADLNLTYSRKRPFMPWG